MGEHVFDAPLGGLGSMSIDEGGGPILKVSSEDWHESWQRVNSIDGHDINSLFHSTSHEGTMDHLLSVVTGGANRTNSTPYGFMGRNDVVNTAGSVTKDPFVGGISSSRSGGFINTSGSGSHMKRGGAVGIAGSAAAAGAASMMALSTSDTYFPRPLPKSKVSVKVEKVKASTAASTKKPYTGPSWQFYEERKMDVSGGEESDEAKSKVNELFYPGIGAGPVRVVSESDEQADLEKSISMHEEHGYRRRRPVDSDAYQDGDTRGPKGKFRCVKCGQIKIRHNCTLTEDVECSSRATQSIVPVVRQDTLQLFQGDAFLVVGSRPDIHNTVAYPERKQAILREEEMRASILGLGARFDLNLLDAPLQQQVNELAEIQISALLSFGLQLVQEAAPVGATASTISSSSTLASLEMEVATTTEEFAEQTPIKNEEEEVVMVASSTEMSTSAPLAVEAQEQAIVRMEVDEAPGVDEAKAPFPSALMEFNQQQPTQENDLHHQQDDEDEDDEEDGGEDLDNDSVLFQNQLVRLQMEMVEHQVEYWASLRGALLSRGFDIDALLARHLSEEEATSPQAVNLQLTNSALHGSYVSELEKVLEILAGTDGEIVQPPSIDTLLGDLDEE